MLPTRALVALIDDDGTATLHRGAVVDTTASRITVRLDDGQEVVADTDEVLRLPARAADAQRWASYLDARLAPRMRRAS